MDDGRVAKPRLRLRGSNDSAPVTASAPAPPAGPQRRRHDPARISFMSHYVARHHKVPSDEQLQTALTELEIRGASDLQVRGFLLAGVRRSGRTTAPWPTEPPRAPLRPVASRLGDL